jgi:hypothetical protein
LHGVAQPGVSNKKFRQRSGTPRGRRHATTSGNLVIPAPKGEYYPYYLATGATFGKRSEKPVGPTPRERKKKKNRLFWGRVRLGALSPKTSHCAHTTYAPHMTSTLLAISRAVDGVRGRSNVQTHRIHRRASVGRSILALRRVPAELDRLQYCAGPPTAREANPPPKKTIFFFFIHEEWDQRASHFVSRRWLRLLNTDNKSVQGCGGGCIAMLGGGR